MKCLLLLQVRAVIPVMNLTSHILRVSVSSVFLLFTPETGNILIFLEGLKVVILS